MKQYQQVNRVKMGEKSPEIVPTVIGGLNSESTVGKLKDSPVQHALELNTIEEHGDVQRNHYSSEYADHVITQTLSNPEANDCQTDNEFGCDRNVGNAIPYFDKCDRPMQQVGVDKTHMPEKNLEVTHTIASAVPVSQLKIEKTDPVLCETRSDESKVEFHDLTTITNPISEDNGSVRFDNTEAAAKPNPQINSNSDGTLRASETQVKPAKYSEKNGVCESASAEKIPQTVQSDMDYIFQEQQERMSEAMLSLANEQVPTTALPADLAICEGTSTLNNKLNKGEGLTMANENNDSINCEGKASIAIGGTKKIYDNELHLSSNDGYRFDFGPHCIAGYKEIRQPNEDVALPRLSEENESDKRAVEELPAINLSQLPKDSDTNADVKAKTELDSQGSNSVTLERVTVNAAEKHLFDNVSDQIKTVEGSTKNLEHFSKDSDVTANIKATTDLLKSNKLSKFERSKNIYPESAESVQCTENENATFGNQFGNRPNHVFNTQDRSSQRGHDGGLTPEQRGTLTFGETRPISQTANNTEEESARKPTEEDNCSAPSGLREKALQPQLSVEKEPDRLAVDEPSTSSCRHYPKDSDISAKRDLLYSSRSGKFRRSNSKSSEKMKKLAKSVELTGFKDANSVDPSRSNTPRRASSWHGFGDACAYPEQESRQNHGGSCNISLRSVENRYNGRTSSGLSGKAVQPQLNVDIEANHQEVDDRSIDSPRNRAIASDINLNERMNYDDTSTITISPVEENDASNKVTANEDTRAASRETANAFQLRINVEKEPHHGECNITSIDSPLSHHVNDSDTNLTGNLNHDDTNIKPMSPVAQEERIDVATMNEGNMAASRVNANAMRPQMNVGNAPDRERDHGTLPDSSIHSTNVRDIHAEVQTKSHLLISDNWGKHGINDNVSSEKRTNLTASTFKDQSGSRPDNYLNTQSGTSTSERDGGLSLKQEEEMRYGNASNKPGRSVARRVGQEKSSCSTSSGLNATAVQLQLSVENKPDGQSVDKTSTSSFPHCPNDSSLSVDVKAKKDPIYSNRSGKFRRNKNKSPEKMNKLAESVELPNSKKVYNEDLRRRRYEWGKVPNRHADDTNTNRISGKDENKQDEHTRITTEEIKGTASEEENVEAFQTILNVEKEPTRGLATLLQNNTHNQVTSEKPQPASCQSASIATKPKPKKLWRELSKSDHKPEITSDVHRANIADIEHSIRRLDYYCYYMQGYDCTMKHRPQILGAKPRTLELSHDDCYSHMDCYSHRHLEATALLKQRVECNCKRCWHDNLDFMLTYGRPIFEDKGSRDKGSQPQGKPKGVVVIANNSKFHDSKNNRPGSHEDGEKLRHCFTQLGFLVHEWPDCEAKLLCDLMRVYTQFPIVENPQSFHYVILSHGTIGKVQGVDGENSSVRDIIRTMEKPGTKIADIPAYLYICTCQGGEERAREPTKTRCDLNNTKKPSDALVVGGANQEQHSNTVSAPHVEPGLQSDGGNHGDEGATASPLPTVNWYQPRPTKNLVVFFAASADQMALRHSEHGTLAVAALCRNILYYSSIVPGKSYSLIECLRKAEEEMAQLSSYGIPVQVPAVSFCPDLCHSRLYDYSI